MDLSRVEVSLLDGRSSRVLSFSESEWEADFISEGDNMHNQEILTRGSIIPFSILRDALAFAPTKTIQKAINDGTGCAYCGKLFSTKAQSLVVPCVAHDHLPVQQGMRKASSSNRKVSASTSSKSVVKKEKDGAENLQQAEQVDDAAKGQKPICNNKFCNKLCRERGMFQLSETWQSVSH